MNKFWGRKRIQSIGEITAKDSRQSLAPRMLTKGDISFNSVEELAYAMSLPVCRNIALTGVFGSGKSSVINTFLASHNAPKNTLRISLSNLLPTEQVLQKPEEKIKYENEIEYKIFQQIIHKADYRKTTQSRFFRINIIDEFTTLKIALHCAIFFICYIIAFEPRTLQLHSFYHTYHSIFGKYAATLNTTADIVAVCVMFLQAIIALRLAIPKLYKFRITSLKASDIEVNFDDKEMLFSKRLGEILYCLKAGEYDAVIFEDLDRISQPQDLFLKLREINILLNESEYFRKKNRIIRFVYAVKDDLFKNEVRTKFFDYIVPVVPVVDEFNSGEYLICHCKDVLKNILDIDIKTLGLFIPRMRDLVNIVNEYRLYENTLNKKSSLSAKKLLAITIYKNLYPTDYSLLHKKRGCLYNVFTQKAKFSQILTSTLEEERTKVISEINKEKESIYKMRMTVLNILSESHRISKLSVAGKFYTLDDIAKNESLYDAFENDKIEQCYVMPTLDDGGGYRKYTYKFDELRVPVDSDDTYYEQLDNYQATLSTNEQSSIELERKIGTIRNMSLGKLMRKMGNGNESLSKVHNICSESCEKKYSDTELSHIAETIHGLIRNGYISEDYSTYISYTYHGSFGEADFKFLHSVIQGTPLDYDYKLLKIKAFINDITSENYDSRCILNYDLANFIFTNDCTEAQKQNFINTARKYPDFVVGYEQYTKCKDEFYERLFNEWNNCLEYIQSIADKETQYTLLRLYFYIAPQSVPLRKLEVDYVNKQYPFICDNLLEFDFKKIKRFLSYFGIKFVELIPHNAITADLFNYVLQFHRFEINTHNLFVIYGEEFRTQAITKILNGTKGLKEYITKDIELLFKNIPTESKNESESSLTFISNQESLSDEQLTSVLQNQQNKIISLSAVPASRYQLLLKEDFVVPSWENVRQYFSQFDELPIVSDFINNHAIDWPAEDLKDGDEQLQLLLFCDNMTLSDEAFTNLAPCCYYLFEPKEIEGLAEKRIEILLDNNLLSYSNEYNQFVSKYSPQLFAKYLIKYINEFMADENEKNFENSNLLGIEILNSALSIEQKCYFLKEFGCIITVEGHEQGVEEYSRLICEFYHSNGIDKDNVDYNLITKALENYQVAGSWHTRIEVINKVHRTVDYVPSRTNRMVLSLGEPYNELVTYSNKTYLDDNPQNNELVNYLKANQPYINKKTPDDGKIKITYHRGNKEQISTE